MVKYLDGAGLTHFWEKIKSKISGDISANTGKMIPYGYCTTAAKTVAKVVTVEPAITELTEGLTIAVKFEYANAVANPTLNVNGFGAHAIKRYGTTAPSTNAASSWNANAVVHLIFDGTYWMLNDWNNTTYSAMSDAEYKAGTSTSERLITPAKLKAAIELFSDKNVNADWDATSGDAQILNKPTIPTVLEPLIGNSSEITAEQVKTALQEGRDICIQTTGSLEGVNLDLRFTSWNSAVDTDYSGRAVNAVVSQTIANYGGVYYLFELVGLIGGSWTLLSTTLAQKSDIPTVPTNISELYNDSGYITESDVEDEIFIATYDSTSYSDILSAYRNGKVIFCKDGPTYVPLTSGEFISDQTNGKFFFRFLDSLNKAKQYYVNSSGWSSGSFSLVTTDIKINGKNLGNNITLTASDVGALPDTTAIPTKTSELINDSGFIAAETDPTVPAWAKASTKPSYTASEVGALANTGGEVTGDITLKSDAATNSKSLIFQRGTLTDNYNDWQIQDRGGFLYFDQRGTNSSSFSNQVCFNTSGNVQATTFNGYSLAGASAKAVDTSISAGSTSANLPTSQAVASFVEGKGYITSAPVSSVNGNTGAVTVRELPSVTSSDNGKVLRVVSGAWSAVSLPSASGVSF